MNQNTFILPQINLNKSSNWYIRSEEEFNKSRDPTYTGPINESNWLIPGILLVGGYPSSINKNNRESKTEKIQQDLINANIDTFVSLNVEYGRRNNHPAYANTIGAIYNKLSKPIFNKTKNFIHFSIEDMQTRNNIGEIIDLCIELYKKIYNGKHIYLHCSGGHGRTGTIAAILLCMLYKITPDDAFEYIQFAHDQRIANKFSDILYNRNIREDDINNGTYIKNLFQNGQVPTPQTSIQRDQVRNIVNKIFSENIIRKLNKNIQNILMESKVATFPTKNLGNNIFTNETLKKINQINTRLEIHLNRNIRKFIHNKNPYKNRIKVSKSDNLNTLITKLKTLCIINVLSEENKLTAKEYINTLQHIKSLNATIPYALSGNL
jgi:hypothetical protein